MYCYKYFFLCPTSEIVINIIVTILLLKNLLQYYLLFLVSDFIPEVHLPFYSFSVNHANLLGIEGHPKL
jgi:hypothetical protein